MATQSSSNNLVAPKALHVFIQCCMEASGAIPRHAACLADVLLAADLRGHYSHGLNRLEMYTRDICEGLCDGKATPVVVKETSATAFVDARNGLGMVAGKFCMELAIKKAKEVGVAWVTCTGSNHYGIAGFYSLMAVQAGLIGISTTNTSPIGVPTRAKKAALGTNPWTFAAPSCNDDAFVLDMATTGVALGKVEVKQMKCESIPKGWGVDCEGQITEDPSKVMDGGGLLYLGGSEETGNYKGYGLAMMVEVLGGILGGGLFGKNLRSWKGDSRVSDLVLHGQSRRQRGQTFIALDPGAFAPGFQDRMGTFMCEMRSLEPVEPEKPVMVAGDPERMHEAKVVEEGGIWYHDNLITAVNTLAAKLGVPPLEVMTKIS